MRGLDVPYLADGVCTGAITSVRDLPIPDTADYNPADYPEDDLRNPRYIGKM